MMKENQYYPQTVTYPGITLAEKLEEMNMGPKEFAIRTGKPEKTITAVLQGKSAITSDMAVLFENTTQIPASFWLNYQRAYDEYQAREKRKEQMKKAVAWSRHFPLSQMMKSGWLVPLNNTAEEKAAALLSFFGMASPSAWEDYYYKQELKVAFRISLEHTQAPYAVSAWLRKGETDAAKLPSKPYAEKVFQSTLPEIKQLMTIRSSNFFRPLQQLCLQAGVKVVYTPCIDKVPVYGATRWLNDTPFIQLTGRYNRNDSFWFSFFHEVGHILLHGKKDIFLEEINSAKSDVKEEEANTFAAKFLLTKEQEQEIVVNLPMSPNKIRFFAKKFNILPAIIVGRLQYKKLLPYSFGREFIRPVDLDK